jgi:hypothetical protein
VQLKGGGCGGISGCESMALAVNEVEEEGVPFQ